MTMTGRNSCGLQRLDDGDGPGSLEAGDPVQLRAQLLERDAWTLGDGDERLGEGADVPSEPPLGAAGRQPPHLLEQADEAERDGRDRARRADLDAVIVALIEEDGQPVEGALVQAGRAEQEGPGVDRSPRSAAADLRCSSRARRAWCSLMP